MTVLWIILGIILLFILILRIPVILELEYTDTVRCMLSWLFLKINIYPFPEKKEKKPKPKKKIRRKKFPKNLLRISRKKRISSKPFTIIKVSAEL